MGTWLCSESEPLLLCTEDSACKIHILRGEYYFIKDEEEDHESNFEYEFNICYRELSDQTPEDTPLLQDLKLIINKRLLQTILQTQSFYISTKASQQMRSNLHFNWPTMGFAFDLPKDSTAWRLLLDDKSKYLEENNSGGGKTCVPLVNLGSAGSRRVPEAQSAGSLDEDDLEKVYTASRDNGITPYSRSALFSFDNDISLYNLSHGNNEFVVDINNDKEERNTFIIFTSTVNMLLGACKVNSS